MPSTDSEKDQISTAKTSTGNAPNIDSSQFESKQSIIDNFAKFETDLYQFDKELTDMINPIAETEIGTSKKQENIDIDQLLKDLKKEGELVLSEREKKLTEQPSQLQID